MYLNHNVSALTVASSLRNAINNLSVSTRRLSSGLRINSSGDDAAGLAIRELLNADIAAYKQGIKNISDAISMIQIHDAALSVIDEKLVRMKELAAQAATGTYNSIQRLMINNEFQSMANEIDRIAQSTEFNGIKLLCHDPNGKLLDMDVPTWSVTNFASNSTLVGAPSSELEVVNYKTILGPMDIEFRSAVLGDVLNYEGDGNIKYWTMLSNVAADIDILFNVDTQKWELLNLTGPGEAFEGYTATTHETDFFLPTPANARVDIISGDGNSMLFMYAFNTEVTGATISSEKGIVPIAGLGSTTRFTVRTDGSGFQMPDIADINIVDHTGLYPNANILDVRYSAGVSTQATMTLDLDLDGDGAVDAYQHFTQHFAAPEPGDGSFYVLEFNLLTSFKSKIHFGTGNDSAEDYYYILTKDSTKKGLGLDNLSVSTQLHAQNALEAINYSIEKKDKLRSYFGSVQNRLENTMAQLQIQNSNFLSARSHINDAEISKEMGDFVKNQILSKSANAMLAQVNNLPNLALKLLSPDKNKFENNGDLHQKQELE